MKAPPETTTIRLSRDPSICLAPGYIADDLLRAEGFTDIRYVPRTRVNPVAAGEVDFLFESAPWIVSQVAAGQPMTVLAGIHSGCYELFAHEPVRTISDLKGRKVGIVGDLVSNESASRYIDGGYMLLAVMAAHVGLDPRRDIDWIKPGPSGTAKQLFVEREVDAFLAAPPEPQELRARKIGRVILNIATDQPWSQYFCCLTSGDREFVQRHPVATKRYLRAVLKAADLCAADPAGAARLLVDAGFTNQYDYARETLTEVPYGVWRDYDPEDTLRFYALRLGEVGMIKSTPQEIIAKGTDWRFLNELKRELKA